MVHGKGYGQTKYGTPVVRLTERYNDATGNVIVIAETAEGKIYAVSFLRWFIWD